MKIQILIPAYKFIPVETVQCLSVIQAAMAERGWKWNIAFVNGFNAAHARNALMNFAIKQEFDYALWIDSDHVFNMKNVDDLLKELQEKNLDCLSAGYFVRDGSKTFAHGRFKEDKSFAKLKKVECKGITECDVLGFGFLLMTHGFIKEMVNKFPNDLFILDCINNTTEDVYFCRKAQEIGKHLYFDANNIVGHLMTAVNK